MFLLVNAGVKGYLAPQDILHPHSKYLRIFGTCTLRIVGTSIPNMLNKTLKPTSTWLLIKHRKRREKLFLEAVEEVLPHSNLVVSV